MLDNFSRTLTIGAILALVVCLPLTLIAKDLPTAALVVILAMAMAGASCYIASTREDGDRYG